MNNGKRTAGEAGWQLSRYNLSARVPGTDQVAMVNLFAGTCAGYSPLELYLLSVVKDLPEDHPIIERFAQRGLITRIDELAALETKGRFACGMPGGVGLTICPTMNCNFACPYCFENRRGGRMSPEVQDDVAALAERMLDLSLVKNLQVMWFGGEPLLAADIIESLSHRLIALAEKKGAGYEARIITNGYLLTQKNVDMLERCRVVLAQVTLDGIGAVHDTTRHLIGGGGTFDRITGNLRGGKIPFRIHIRQNVQEHNMDEVHRMSEFIQKLAAESDNQIDYTPAPVVDNEAARERGGPMNTLCETNLSEISLKMEADRFLAGRGYYCGAAHTLMSVGIDEEGRLFKCWETAGNPAFAYGTARNWDPDNPLSTAAEPDNLTKYLNTALPIHDAECLECVWLPVCAGGCPHRRVLGKKQCVAFRDAPERYVLALHARI